jgi:hypothetical protein
MHSNVPTNSSHLYEDLSKTGLYSTAQDRLYNVTTASAAAAAAATVAAAAATATDIAPAPAPAAAAPLIHTTA